MTNLIEEIEIKITINHCLGDSAVLGGPNDLRASAVVVVTDMFAEWLTERATKASCTITGVEVDYVNTGLFEAPEIGGGDN